MAPCSAQAGALGTIVQVAAVEGARGALFEIALQSFDQTGEHALRRFRQAQISGKKPRRLLAEAATLHSLTGENLDHVNAGIREARQVIR